MIERKGRYWVYIIKCKDGSYYTGYTNDLENRVKLHKSGKGAKYLRGKGPLKLIHSEEYKYFRNAIKRENEIKSLTKPEKKEIVLGKKCKSKK
jgi:putative endonuclease